MIIDEENYLAHYGVLRKSGRYPWGSGATAEQRSRDFLGTVADLKKKGLTDHQIMTGFGMNTTDFRAAKSIAKNTAKQADIRRAQTLKDKGYSNVAIGKHMGINESSVRSLLEPGAKDRNDILTTTRNSLKDQVEKKNYLDVGSGVEAHMGISTTNLHTAIAALKEEGYKVQYVKVPTGKNQFTTIKVLTKPDVPYSEVFKNRDKIQQFTDYSEDGGRSKSSIQPPIQISSKRIDVKYKEDGGGEADGVIYVRPGVHDVSLGGSRYAQVRIAVDGTHYLKGVAMYKDDLPKGIDLQFNTNKSKADAPTKLSAMKAVKDDPENPFGATVRQLPKLDEHGKAIPDTVRSAMNIVNEEGDWNNWSRSLSTQFLSKQSPALAKTQLDMTFERRKQGLNEILALTNPTVRKKLLESYAEDIDSAAVHLKAAALPRQASHVILPIKSLKDTEIYAPNFRNGEQVVLVRHPHGGPFEIPELTVNNNHPEAKKMLGQAKDAVGINSHVAAKLSGADFDGDSVLVIPNGNRSIKTAPTLAGLKGFDAQAKYKLPEDAPRMTAQQKQTQMGLVSNLITDMSICKASSDELAAAVRHSMVVIDAEKHHLDYKASALDNNIAGLMKKYQGRSQGGSSTLISRATSPKAVLERKQGFRVDPATGKKIFTETGASYVDLKGKTVFRTTKTTKLADTEDANTLSSGTVIEKIYADHSNALKALANTARKEAVNTKTVEYSPSAKATYGKEVQSLNAKLNLAIRNRPLERQARVLANASVSLKKHANPEMDSAELKKIQKQELDKARLRTGAEKQSIKISDEEWHAIQAGAISNNKLSQILNNADLERVKELATPRTPTVMTSIKQSRAKQMIESGYTQAEVADALGVPLSTLKSALERM